MPKTTDRLLDGEELNLGSTQVAKVPLPRPFLHTDVATGEQIRLLDLSCRGKNARTVTLFFSQKILETQQNPLANTSGPVSGIVEFGNGAALSTVEFDIPSVSRIPGNSMFPISGNPPAYPDKFKNPAISGVSLTVTAASLRAFARNDNNLPLVFDPLRIIGSANETDLDPTVSCFIGYGQTLGANKVLRKTIYIVDSGSGSPDMPPATDVDIGVPAFSKTVRFPRTPIQATALRIEFDSFFGATYGDYIIPAGSDGPLEVPPDCYRIIVTADPTNLVDIDNLSAIFDLSL
jgi:hypothetical protein